MQSIGGIALAAILGFFSPKDDPNDPRAKFDAERTALQQLFGFGSSRSAEHGLGPIWGFYSGDESVRVWLNGEATGTRVENVKLSIVKMRDQPVNEFAFTAARKLFERYVPDLVGQERHILETCEGYKAQPRWSFIFHCRKGPNADEFTYEFQTNRMTE